MNFDPKNVTEEGLAHLKEAVNADVNPVESLGIDPGSRNGICGYDSRHYLQFMYSINEKDVTLFLRAFTKLKRIIIEDYRLYPNKTKQQVYSDMLTPRVIGRVEDYCTMRDIELIKQGASIKDTGYKWIGKKPPPKGNPKRDPMDAHVHFMYWAIKNRHIDAGKLITDDIS